ncbi:hypothetical protein N7492_009362 [Penicillium capsulatum]|uniref:PWWP domain-containing protein n=1 Tax=Penicillium capsulatum TaxID=69766 RepID=A0A9W9HWZ7_9EURO|nr:hypothetical protein N7492_009362 [Penicillium capsulatum]KAJ6106755.1 hypothetical protein N7512_010272 [Penicillium capsulatum]
MAEVTPVDAPAEAPEQPEPTQNADTKTEAEKATASDDKPTAPPSLNDPAAVRPESANPSVTPLENANATDDAKKPDADAEKAAGAEEATDSKAEGDAAATPAANGAPAAAKKSAKDRRRSSGVGEKKLNRKKSQNRITHLNVQPGEYYLARLRSYAPWPAIICDEEMLPQSLQDTRPTTAIQKDGTYRADYADDGKRAHERTYPVMFFDSNEFAWIPNTQLTPLDPAECKDVSEKNKAKGLYRAYQVAANGHDLKYFKDLLADHQAALQQELEEEEAKEAAKEAAKAEKAEKTAKKPKRKSKAADTDVEMEDADDTKKTKAAPKKRKKDAETDGEAEKPAKNAKTGGTKIKLTNKKTPADEDAKSAAASKPKKGGSKKAKAAASDEEEAAEAKEPEKQIDPEELKKKKEKEVLFLRHKLQKGFISRDQPPKEDEMATMGTYFDKLEKHADLEVSIIRSTKINKVLKMIVKLNSIPRDEEFNFRHRAMDVLSKWKNVLDNEAPSGSAQAKSDANGAPKDDDAVETPKLETEEEKEPEAKISNEDSEMVDADLDKAEPEETEKATPKDEAKGEKPADKATEKPTEDQPVEASA